MTDAEKFYARRRALQLLSQAIESSRAMMQSNDVAIEYHRTCARTMARQTETLLELANVLQEETKMVEMKAEAAK